MGEALALARAAFAVNETLIGIRPLVVQVGSGLFRTRLKAREIKIGAADERVAIRWRRVDVPVLACPTGVIRQETATTITWERRLRWLALAIVPSSLMLGVTTFLSTDVASMPLLWVAPLTLYLLSFVIGFSSTPLIGQRIQHHLRYRNRHDWADEQRERDAFKHCAHR